MRFVFIFCRPLPGDIRMHFTVKLLPFRMISFGQMIMTDLICALRSAPFL